MNTRESVEAQRESQPAQEPKPESLALGEYQFLLGALHSELYTLANVVQSSERSSLSLSLHTYLRLHVTSTALRGIRMSACAYIASSVTTLQLVVFVSISHSYSHERESCALVQSAYVSVLLTEL